MTRRWPGPADPQRTVHFLGDIHFSTGSGGIHSSRPPLITTGLGKVMVPQCAATVHTGDCTTNGTTDEDALYLAWLAGLPKLGTYRAVPGNHDILLRSAEDAATALSMPNPPWVQDVGFAVLVGFMPGDSFADDNSGSRFTYPRMAALEAVIAAQTKPVWLVDHFPFYGTVGAAADPALAYRSIDNGFYISTPDQPGDSSEFLAMLAEYPQVKALVCGHTHSNLGTDQLVTTVTAGSNKIASVNTSALASVDRALSASRYQFGPLNTLFVTSNDDDHFEVRYRAHDGGGYWTTRGVGGEMVTTIDLT